MKEESDDEEDKIESVEKIPEKKEEVKEAAPLAYDMESGTLLNNREELSEALKNIRKCDSDGEEIEKFAIEARKRAKNRVFDSGINEVGDEEGILTHRGESLQDMERFDDPDLSEDENDQNPGHLTTEQTEALFGGGVLKKKDHKEIMLDVIAKSKK